MASYVEQEDLVVGTIYVCEDYDGNTLLLRYDGDGMFGARTVDGEIRYAFRPATHHEVIQSLRDGEYVERELAPLFQKE